MNPSQPRWRSLSRKLLSLGRPMGPSAPPSVDGPHDPARSGDPRAPFEPLEPRVLLSAVDLAAATADEPPAAITILATPEISVRGNGANIPDGDTSRSSDNGTDLGAATVGT